MSNRFGSLDSKIGDFIEVWCFGFDISDFIPPRSRNYLDGSNLRAFQLKTQARKPIEPGLSFPFQEYHLFTILFSGSHGNPAGVKELTRTAAIFDDASDSKPYIWRRDPRKKLRKAILLGL